jgi:hypothetical protein
MLMLLPAVNARRSAVVVLLFMLPRAACVQGTSPISLTCYINTRPWWQHKSLRRVLDTGCVHTCMCTELCKGVVAPKHDVCMACSAGLATMPGLHCRPEMHADGWLPYANLQAQLCHFQGLLACVFRVFFNLEAGVVDSGATFIAMVWMHHHSRACK